MRLPTKLQVFANFWPPKKLQPFITLRTLQIYLLKLLIEKRREYNLKTHLLFIDYEKAFDSIQRQILFHILKSRNIPDTLLKQEWTYTHKTNINKI